MSGNVKSGSDSKRPWFEPVSAILMAVASLSTAWCSYQSSSWSGTAADFAVRADRCERRAMAMQLQSNQYTSVESMLFMQFIEARLSGSAKLADFYLARFSPQLREAYDKWIQLHPLENPDVSHPFSPEFYKPRFAEEIQAMREKAGDLSAHGKAAGKAANRYLSLTVLLAIVLFSIATSGQFDRRLIRQSSLAFSAALFGYVLVRILMLPAA
jgi:hypothetical protein